MLEYIVLGALNNRCLTGYDIRHYIEQGIGLFYKASFGSIYPILSNLNKRGLVSFTDELHGKRKSKLYSITEKGKNEFLEWLEGKECNSVDEFMAVVYFLDALPENVAAKKIDVYIKNVDSYINKLREKEVHYMTNHNMDNYYYMMSTLKYGIYSLINLKKWCSQLAKKSNLNHCLGAKTPTHN